VPSVFARTRSHFAADVPTPGPAADVEVVDRSRLLFPVYTGVLVWLGLYLRSAALRALVRAGS
jgi:hypothetical protein